MRLWYSPFLSREDRHDEALAEARRAGDLDPLAPGPKIALAYSGLAARRLDVVVREAAGAASLEPSLMRPRAFQALRGAEAAAPPIGNVGGAAAQV